MTHNRIIGLDLVRSLAIFLVLLLHISESVHHFPPVLFKAFSTGWAGVDIFFVLSGFLIGSQVFKGKDLPKLRDNLKNFWVKRWFRTFPLYLSALIVYVFIKPLLGWEFNDTKLKFFTFFQNYFAPRDFVQSWSLCIEEQFYLVFPLLFFLIPNIRTKAWLWPIPILISMYARYEIVTGQVITNAQHLSYLIRFPTHTHMDGICLGVFLSFTQKSWNSFAQKNHRLLFIIGLVGFIISLIYFGHTPLNLYAVFAYTSHSIFSALMIMGAMFLKLPKVTHFPLYWTATLSYGMYLWNNLFMRVMDKYFHNYHWILSSIIFLIITYVFSYITFKLIEEPIMKRRSIFLK